jgi:hypothetical protein
MKTCPLKITLLALLATSYLLQAPTRGAVDLASFGTSSFTIDSGFTSVTATQTATSLTMSTPIVLGTVLYGDFGSTFNWSTAPELAFSFSSLAAPNISFFVDFLKSDASTAASFSGSLASVGSSPTTVALTLAPGSSIANLTNVKSVFFTWGGDSVTGDTAVTLHSVQSVPEPSTYALLALAGAALVVYRLRRRRA